MNGRPFDPPILLDDNDPRTLAWIDGWECADHELKAKNE